MVPLELRPERWSPAFGKRRCDAGEHRIIGFDGLRAAAFLMVFVSHKVPSPRTEPVGSAGVWLFFVLSGFLIVRILAASRARIEAGAATPMDSLRAFYRNRFARIVPVYYVFLLALYTTPLGRSLNLGDEAFKLSTWLYGTNFYVERHGWGTELGHLWSLAVEQQFYLLFAPAALFLPRRYLGALCGALIGASVLMHVALWSAGAWPVSFDVDTVVNLGLIALGGLAGLRAAPLPGWLRSDAAMVGTLALFMTLPPLVGEMDRWLVVGRLSGLLAALLLLQIVQSPESRTVALLDSPWLRRIGVISYGAYLFHVPLHAEMVLAALGLPLAAPRPVTLALDLALTLLLAEASWRLLESPARRILRAPTRAARRPALINPL
ncbi:acyltransferase family protein [Methylobacterium pseudosasicola]|uniref:Peptidoglycan/LPS O-acetylase OafA/YrhL, contains acyltransferase and SGNH-hydrolase domains n=1 Tax=Methylobacterium pseudosasicola TaxID=582667 RepID=A0A1I4HDP2_9HYPH|nr:acyltransferase [Methylobacterium pseudosasicola]SFL40359.1 Peptidoglycan/LPS O-acetylase OafA/YrhL, contains acyltransferase and SGNH-hydrolase domains [Methylobacterium pseudosasicola]